MQDQICFQLAVQVRETTCTVSHVPQFASLMSPASEEPRELQQLRSLVRSVGAWIVNLPPKLGLWLTQQNMDHRSGEELFRSLVTLVPAGCSALVQRRAVFCPALT